MLWHNDSEFINEIRTMLGITDVKVGRNIVLDGAPYVVTWNQHSKQARGGGVMKTKLKNLMTGGSIDRTFQGSDKIEAAEVNFQKAQFLYSTGDDFEFMDQETYDTITFDRARLGEQVDFLTDGMEVDIQYFNGTAINVQLPTKMTFEVVQTDQGVKGDTATGGSKPATLDTGYVVKVPLFVNVGDKIVVNTLSGEYIERSKE